MSSRITVNVGLRWDYESPRRERYDRMIRGFAFDQTSPIARAVLASPASTNCPACQAGLRGGLLYAGAEGSASDAFIPHKLNFQPRVGVAWRATNRIVFRAGYGLSNLGQSSNGPPTGYSRQTPVIASLVNNITPAVSLNDPFPASSYPNGLRQPIGNSAGLSTNLGQNVTFQYLDRPLPRAQQYSAGFQVSLPYGWLIEASYAGNRTDRLPVTLPINFIPGATLENLPVSQRQAYFNQQVANPMAELLPNSALNGPTVALQQLLYAFPKYGAGSQMTDVPIGSQRYDSLQLKASHRLAVGLALTAAFTVSKTFEQVSALNAQDVNLGDPLRTPLEKRLVQFDFPQQFSLIGTYDLPFGSHRHSPPRSTVETPRQRLGFTAAIMPDASQRNKRILGQSADRVCTMFRFQTVALLTLVLIGGACSSSRVSPTSAAPEIASVIAVRPLAEVHPVLGVDDRIHLAYELLVVDFSSVLVSLYRVETLSASGGKLDELAGDALLKRVRIGGGESGKTLGASHSGFMLMDVSIPKSSALPSTIRHCIVTSRQLRATPGDDHHGIPMPPGSLIEASATFIGAETSVDPSPAIAIASPLRGPGWLIGNACCDELNPHIASIVGRLCRPPLARVADDMSKWIGRPKRVSRYPAGQDYQNLTGAQEAYAYAVIWNTTTYCPTTDHTDHRP